MKHIREEHIVLFIVELSVGLTFGGLSAALFIPFCIKARGYFAIGGEWAIIIFAGYASYSAINNWFFRRLSRRYK